MIKSLGVIMVKNYLKKKKLGPKSFKIAQRFNEDIGLSFLQFDVGLSLFKIKDIYEAEEFFELQSCVQEDEETIKKCTSIGALLKTAATFGANLREITYMKDCLVIRLDFYNRQMCSEFKKNTAGLLKS